MENGPWMKIYFLLNIKIQFSLLLFIFFSNHSFSCILIYVLLLFFIFNDYYVYFLLVSFIYTFEIMGSKILTTEPMMFLNIFKNHGVPTVKTDEPS